MPGRRTIVGEASAYFSNGSAKLRAPWVLRTIYTGFVSEEPLPPIAQDGEAPSPPRRKQWAKFQPSLLGVTCVGKSDGGGAQVHAVLSGMLFAKLLGVPYLHTPFRSVSHNASAKRAASKWERAFNLGRGFQAPPADAPVVTWLELKKGYSGPPAVLSQPHFHKCTERFAADYSDLMPELRARLALPHSTQVGATIAVHIRRGSVSDTKHVKRYTPTAAVARSIETAKAMHPGAKVVVYSEGKPREFAGLPEGCTLDLNKDVFATLSGMIAADCLIMAKSSFSYVAGLYSRGTVFYEPFWHQPLPHWHRLDDGH